MSERFELLKVLIRDLPYRANGVPLLYYCGHSNFGDLLGRVLLESIAGKRAYRVFPRNKKHMVFLGSILSAANDNSVVAGAGFISETSKMPSAHKIFYVRGEKTKKILSAQGVNSSNLPIGDPAQLLAIADVRQKFEKIISSNVRPLSSGPLVVLHHTTAERFGLGLKHRDSFGRMVISTGTGLGSVYDAIKSASFVISNALHPLIVADSIGVPNRWIEFKKGQDVIGGGFKFRDYYSSTTNSIDRPEIFANIDELLDALEKIEGQISRLKMAPTVLLKLTLDALSETYR